MSEPQDILWDVLQALPPDNSLMPGTSSFARFYDSSSKYWQADMDLNRMFVEIQQSQAEWLLLTRGYLFLNEVFDLLGLSRMPHGQIFGWELNPSMDPEHRSTVEFYSLPVTPLTPAEEDRLGLLLDFNVDGAIWDRFISIEENQ